MSSVSSIRLNVYNTHCIVKEKDTPVSCKIHTMEHDDRPEPAKRLEKARIARGFDEAKKAAHYFGWNYNTYAQHENGTNGITRASAKYAKAFRVSEAWLLTGEGPGPGEDTGIPGLRRVTVAAHIQAGVFEETWAWDEHDQYDVFVPDDPEYRGFSLHAAETRGPSMNRRYPERTILVFTNVEETREPPVAGKRYIVERRRSGGEAEHTVKLLHIDVDGKYWLVPESDDPRFQAPISVEDGTGDEDVVAIIGRVVYAVSRE